MKRLQKEDFNLAIKGVNLASEDPLLRPVWRTVWLTVEQTLHDPFRSLDDGMSSIENSPVVKLGALDWRSFKRICNLKRFTFAVCNQPLDTLKRMACITCDTFTLVPYWTRRLMHLRAFNACLRCLAQQLYLAGCELRLFTANSDCDVCDAKAAILSLHSIFQIL